MLRDVLEVLSRYSTPYELTDKIVLTLRRLIHQRARDAMSEGENKYPCF